MSEPFMEVLIEEKCLRLLSQVPVGRVGITVGSLPVILPVNYAFVDGFVVFQTSPGTKLRAATSNTVVAFEIDSYEPDGPSGWSVLVQGTASQVPVLEAANYFVALGTSWGAPEIAGGLVRIKVERISGRRFGFDVT